MQQENADLTRQLEEAESGGSALTKLRAQLSAQLEDLKRSLEEETRVRLLIDACYSWSVLWGDNKCNKPCPEFWVL